MCVCVCVCVCVLYNYQSFITKINNELTCYLYCDNDKFYVLFVIVFIAFSTCYGFVSSLSDCVLKLVWF